MAGRPLWWGGADYCALVGQGGLGGLVVCGVFVGVGPGGCVVFFPVGEGADVSAFCVGVLNPALRGLGGGSPCIYGAADQFSGVVVGVGVSFYGSVVDGLGCYVPVDIIVSLGGGVVGQGGLSDGVVVWGVFVGTEGCACDGGSDEVSKAVVGIVVGEAVVADGGQVFKGSILVGYVPCTLGLNYL